MCEYNDCMLTRIVCCLPVSSPVCFISYVAFFLCSVVYLFPSPALQMLQRHSYDKAVDIWALGVIVFVLLCGCLPFDDDSSRIANESAARKKFTLRFPRWASTLSVSAKDLLHNLLDVNPKTRYTAGDFLDAIY